MTNDTNVQNNEVTYLPITLAVELGGEVPLNNGQTAIIIGKFGDKVLGRMKYGNKEELFVVTGVTLRTT